MLQCVAVCCSVVVCAHLRRLRGVLQCAAVCCSVLQCVDSVHVGAADAFWISPCIVFQLQCFPFSVLSICSFSLLQCFDIIYMCTSYMICLCV